jgi:uncharacterized protein (TIGR00288 family)
MLSKVAVFVVGDNLSGCHASTILNIARSQGNVALAKVYGNENALIQWSDRSEFQFVYSGRGKNASDLHLAIDATELTLAQSVDVVVLCTSDADFVHLARRLKERGIVVIGCGETKATSAFRQACSDFRELVAPVKAQFAVVYEPVVMDLNAQIRTVIAENSREGAGVRLSDLAPLMHSKHGTQISQHPDRTWRGYLAKQKDLFDLDPRGLDAKVRFKPQGFHPRQVAG